MGVVCCGGLEGLSEPSPHTVTSQGLCAITLCGLGAMYGLKCPEEVLGAIREGLGRENLKGDGLSEKAPGLHKFNLSSRLWMSNGKKTVEVRRIIMRVVEELSKRGWEIVEEVDMSRAGLMQVWILRRSDAVGDYNPRPNRKDFMVSMHSSDDVRVLCESDPLRTHSVIEAVRNAIEACWKVSKENEYGGVHQFVLKGSPFGAFGANGENSVKIRRMLLAICAQVEKQTGAKLYKSLSLSVGQGSKSSLIFRQVEDYGESGPVEYLGLSLNDTDDVRLISLPGEPLDETVKDSLRAAIVEGWPRGIQKEGEYGGAFEWKLLGRPWDAHGTETVDSRLLVGKMLKKMWALGFELMPKIDCSGKLADMSLMVFRRPREGGNRLPESEPVLGLSLHDADDIRLTCTEDSIIDSMEQVIRIKDTMGNSSPVGIKIFGIGTHELNQLRIGFGGVKGLREPEPYTPTSEGYCALVLSNSSRVYGYKCPEEVLEAVRKAVKDQGIIKNDRKCKKVEGLHEIEFIKWVWAANGKATVDVRRYALKMVEALREVGWGIVDDLDMSRPFFVQVWVLHKIDRLSERSSRRDLMISLHDKNDIRIILEDEANRLFNVQEAVRQGIVNCWQITSETDYSGAYQFQLAGAPFSAGCDKPVEAKQILLSVITELERQTGYRLVRTLSLSQNRGAKSSLVLRVPPPEAASGNRGKYMGMSLDEADLIRIFPAPGEFLDASVQQEIGGVISKAWANGVDREGGFGTNAYEWKLQGKPWSTEMEDTVEARILMAKILQKMLSLGFELMPKIDCTGRLAETSFMVFRRTNEAVRSEEAPVVCVWFNNIDEMRICSPDRALVDELQPKIRMALCPPQFSIEAVQDLSDFGKSAQLKLVKSPFHTWMPGPKTVIYPTAILISVINVMSEIGWELKASLDLSRLCVSTESEWYRLQLSSLYFTPRV
ncbi:hypothetical protein FOL47_010184 [Perkinsus chesapeaki]|uniref:Uncharacterized protein n=1 Tax=Perkinsus chesapeaki TaxID=330153 RepID=A0A7J6MQ30_PERCH|nr:hypothetical protein FOL47_010184 [Perkinsus chesapeaki]